LGAKESVEYAVIEREREVDASRDGDPAGPRDNALILTSDSKDARLAGIDDRFESVGAAPAKVGNRERDWRKIGL
jgi:hypothetical protein